MWTRQQWIRPYVLLLRICSLGYIPLLISGQNTFLNASISWGCTDNLIKIQVYTSTPFRGVIYGENHKDQPSCAVNGTGLTTTEIAFDFLESAGPCGQTFDKETQVVSITIRVRSSYYLEQISDRTFIANCSKGNVIQLGNGAAIMNLNLYSDKNEKVEYPVEGEKYILRSDLQNSDNSRYIQVGQCKAFTENFNTEIIDLTDKSGCPVNSDIMSAFDSNKTKSSMYSWIYSMFRFINKRKLFIQCTVYICERKCLKDISCSGNGIFQLDPSAKNVSSSLVVYVQDPGTVVNDNCGYNSWLLGLCIAFGILFLIMLIVNIFMCTAMSCTCTKKVLVEEELEDYDPYKMGWVPASSLYSNRYGSARGPYSHASTLESRVPSTSSEQYAVVNSPPSRFSAPSTKERLGSSISNTYYSSHV